VRRQWLWGVSPKGIGGSLGRSRHTVREIIDWNTSGGQWPETSLELPPWIDAV
jgi:hypothetical protein